MRKKMNNFNESVDEFYRKFDVMIDILPEFMAVRHGLRKALTFTIEPHKNFKKSYLLIKDFCLKAGLHVEHYPSKLDRRNQNVLISRKKMHIIDDDKDENEDNRFSYPSCCIKAFSKKIEHPNYFNDDARELLKNEDTFDFRINPFTINSPFHLISHLPCSLRCKKTINYSSNLLNAIKKQNKLWYSQVLYFNKVYVLYLDMCGIGILLKGRLSAGQIRYKDFYPRRLYEKRIDKSIHYSAERYKMFQGVLRSLSKGNSIMLKGDRLTIKNNGRVVRVFQKPEDLFWKIINFI